ncbi:unnamed protein product [Oikopleura dioica]|uniref:Uncharacterized protein n=1 Tax=Oikopleura dioica TaxID=34765 RepID=E4WSZ3_OIKDI|nr:unnamed protein product [Oikopleura dioica]
MELQERLFLNMAASETWGSRFWYQINPCVRGLLRSQIRKKKMIPGSFVTDVFVHCFCANCAMVQETKELNSMDRLLNGNSIAPAEKPIDRT